MNTAANWCFTQEEYEKFFEELEGIETTSSELTSEELKEIFEENYTV